MGSVLHHQSWIASISSNHSVAQASEGIRQSPRGDSVADPTYGPSGRQERLNCCIKKRRKNVRSHLRMTSSE